MIYVHSNYSSNNVYVLEHIFFVSNVYFIYIIHVKKRIVKLEDKLNIIVRIKKRVKVHFMYLQSIMFGMSIICNFKKNETKLLKSQKDENNFLYNTIYYYQIH